MHAITFNVTIIDIPCRHFIDTIFQGGNNIIDAFFPPLRLKKNKLIFRVKTYFIFIFRRQETAKLVKDNRCFTLNIISIAT
ncbi:Uncharacterised protein [Salmonella enterica subsp. enterica serovar Bovismorbificans]|nr:Uncharacterised protein [Salmonella enterica subsp. enterica serovar Bovismorbificans]